MSTTGDRRGHRRSRRILVGLVLGALVLVNGALIWYAVSRLTPGDSATASALIYAQGNVRAGPGSAAPQVATMLGRHNFDALLMLGDQVSGMGALTEFEDEYDPVFGSFAQRTRPTPGDGEYSIPEARGYFTYFTDRGRHLDRRPYYAFSFGGWRLYSLNSEIAHGTPDAPMFQWLLSDLEARPSDCILAYWHGGHRADGEATEGMELIETVLAARGAEIILDASERNYQRHAPRSGVTRFVVGTGGEALEPLPAATDGVAFAVDDTHGSLELVLRPGVARYGFRTVDDKLIDEGELRCQPPDGGPDEVPPTLPTDAQYEAGETGDRITWGASTDDRGLLGYVVTRGLDPVAFTTEPMIDLPPASGTAVYGVAAIDQAGNLSDAVRAAGTATTAGFRDFEWGTLDENPVAPTADKAQSKVWWHDGSWWGLLFRPGSADTRGFHIMRLDGASQSWVDTGARADERDRSRADVLWDESAEKLYILSTARRGSIKLYRYSYESGAFALDEGYPARISEDGSESVAIARDSNGVLWATATKTPEGGQCVEESPCTVQVAHSLDRDFRWTPFTTLPFDQATVSPDDISAVAAYGEDEIGVIFSNQAVGGFFFASRADDAADDEWTIEVIEENPRVSDDHMNFKVDAQGRPVVVGKTSLNDPANAPPDLALVTLYIREGENQWRRATIWTVADDVTRPQVVVTEDEIVAVAAYPSGGGAIYAKRAPLTDPVFVPGLGDLLMTDADLNNPTMTKQLITVEMGSPLVLASADETRTYWHAVVGSGPPE
ncbi:MAG: hypothetical protein K5924_06425 [Chloroflexi bacterium]|nr:hypothetical protein [Chloroflexota bacterium]